MLLRQPSFGFLQSLPGEEAAGSVVQHAMRRFIGWSILVLAALVLGAGLVGARISEATTLQEAKVRAGALADRVVAPLVDDEVRSDVPGAADPIRDALASRLSDGSLVHAKVWSPNGKVIWADEEQLIGQRFDLSPRVQNLFGGTGAVAEVSDLSRDENVSERDERSLLEVYTGVSDADGRPIVFEAYLSTEPLAQRSRTLIIALLSVAAGSLLLFSMAVFPLALSLARRVDRSQRDRAKLLAHSLRASELERSRIAQDLHDGIIQDLAGIGYLMPTLVETLESRGTAPDVGAAITRAGEILRRDVVALRSLITDIYPPDLSGPGFELAVDELAEDARAAGLLVDVTVDVGDDLPIDAGRLAYRVLREGLRNVLHHADAHAVVISVERAGHELQVRVSDDGAGLGGGSPLGTAASTGHFGLTFIADTLADLDGRIELVDRPGRGVRLEVAFPVHLVAD